MAEKILSYFSSILNSFSHIGYTCACAQIKFIGGTL